MAFHPITAQFHIYPLKIPEQLSYASRRRSRSVQVGKRRHPLPCNHHTTSGMVSGCPVAAGTIRCEKFGPVAVWCRSFDSVMCNKGDEPWAQEERKNFEKMRCELL